MTMIVGIDPSLSGTAVVAGESSDRWTCERFSSKPSGQSVIDRVRRIDSLVSRIMKPLEHCCGKDTLILIEGYSFASDVSRARFTAEFGGVLRWHLVDVGHVVEVQPRSLKKFITGSGAGKKLKMIASLSRDPYNVEFSTDDEYDAYACFRLGFAFAGIEECRNASQRQVISQMNPKSIREQLLQPPI